MKTRTIVTALIPCMTLGCSTPQGTSAVECGAGAAGGAFLLCKAFGGKDDTCAAVAAAGGVGGATICYSYADNLEKRRQQLAGHENDLDARLAYVRGLNQDAEKLNAQLRSRVAEVTRHTNDTVAKVQQGQMNQQRLKEEQTALDNEIAAANQQAAQARAALQDMKRFRAQQAQRSEQLDAEIAKQTQLLEETERQTSALASQRQRV
jgi:hypothetical protein